MIKCFLMCDFPGDEGGYIRLWLALKIPAVVPVGSNIWLPTPKSWRPVTGLMSGTVSRWDILNDKLVCKVVPDMRMDQDGADELVAIGYSREELDSAEDDKLFR